MSSMHLGANNSGIMYKSRIFAKNIAKSFVLYLTHTCLGHHSSRTGNSLVLLRMFW